MSDKPKMYAWTPENVKPENYVTAMNLMLARIDELVAIKERLERELAEANSAAKGSADLVCSQREKIAALEAENDRYKAALEKAEATQKDQAGKILELNRSNIQWAARCERLEAAKEREIVKVIERSAFDALLADARKLAEALKYIGDVKLDNFNLRRDREALVIMIENVLAPKAKEALADFEKKWGMG
jgi:hypothetical protein